MGTGRFTKRRGRAAAREQTNVELIDVVMGISPMVGNLLKQTGDLARAGRHDRAVPILHHCIGLVRAGLLDLATADGVLAVCHWRLATSLRALGETQQALTARDEAKRLTASHEDRRPGSASAESVYADVFLDAVRDMVDLGEHEVAVEIGAEALRVLRDAVQAGKGEEREVALIACLGCVAEALDALGRTAEALDYRAESVDLTRTRVETGSTELSPILAVEAAALAARYGELGQVEDALAAVAQCGVGLSRGEASANLDPADLTDIATNMRSLCIRLVHLGDVGQGLTEPQSAELAAVLHTVARLLAVRGHTRESELLLEVRAGVLGGLGG